MMIDDQELRALVRSAIARHTMGGPEQPAAPPPGMLSAPLPPSHSHASHLRFLLWSGGDADGVCLIEPAVRCTHCGYCQSYGH